MLFGIDLTQLVATYGVWAVMFFVAIESMGIPVPGETMLLIAAVYAGATHHLSIAAVIAAAAVGAIIGDNLGFLIGRLGGERLLRRVGPALHLTAGRLILMRYLFQRHGGKAVFFGRFVTVLRIFAAFLAGINGMPWRRFALYNAAGGIAWATLIGLLGYGLGASVTGPLGYIGLALAVVIVVIGVVVLRRNEQRWEREATRVLSTTPDADPGHGSAAKAA